MDHLSIIRQPIEAELKEFIGLFDESLSHTDGMLSDALEHIRQRGGKRMRPILTLLMAKNLGEAKFFGGINDKALQGAAALEMLHNASLIHDDVVDESGERRGQASVNAMFNNKVAVLVGDFILSSALLYVSRSGNSRIITSLAELGQTLSQGELLQLNNFSEDGISEDIYYQIIRQKTASLFARCAMNGALSVDATDEEGRNAYDFGMAIGMIFQIRDDIFDYFDSKEIGKPTGNDMAEGKLTLPIIHALKKTANQEMLELAKKVKKGFVKDEEIHQLVKFAIDNGGIDYAVKRMDDFSEQAQRYIDFHVKQFDIKQSLQTYLNFVANRNN